MIKFIATDIDGTLANDKREIHKSVFSTIEYLRSKNIKFCASSGRQYLSLKNTFEGYTDDMVFIAENGAYVVHNGQEIYSNSLEKELWQKIVQSIINDGFGKPILCCKNYVYVEEKGNDDIIKILGDENFNYKMKFIDSLLNVDDDILKISVNYNGFDTNEASKALNEKFGSVVDIAGSGFGWIDITNKGVSKGTAINKVFEKFGIVRNEALAFGDNFNDIEMFKEVHYSYAMKNASDEVKKFANYVTDYDNNECGVVKTIESFIEKGVI